MQNLKDSELINNIKTITTKSNIYMDMLIGYLMS